MRDAQAVQLGRQAVDSHVQDTQPNPAGLEPPIRSEHDRQSEDDRAESLRRAQIWSFSITGATETTCRLNLSSDSSRPAATPTSCDRWRIGMP